MMNNAYRILLCSALMLLSGWMINGNCHELLPPDITSIKLNAIRTSEIGTVDHPTIDGGMINAEDGLPVVRQTTPLNHVKPFEDSWARSKEVKSVLDKAIHEGKLNYVINESEKRKLPASVALVPVVESNYSDRVVSPKGAAGLWQIMPLLANDYQLKESDRFDVKKSTQVALDHIEKLYGQFGNWELAFAAYNAGSKRLIEALHQNPNAKSIDELALPAETKMYVKKIKFINQVLMAM